jgi:hypothetical protein
MAAPAAGYYREADYVLYVNTVGDVYYVWGIETTEPAWRKTTPLEEDASPATLDDDDFELFERVRVAYGIPE